MKPKYQLLTAERRLEIAKDCPNLTAKEKEILVMLIQLEITGELDGKSFDNIPNKVYHHGLCPGFSYTSVNQAAISSTNWLLSDVFETHALKMGSGFHTALLEPHLFGEEYPKDYFSSADILTLSKMVQAARSHKSFDSIFKNSFEKKVEFTVFAKCPVSGLMRKVRPDVLVIKRALIDYKTTGADGSNEFEQRADQYHYEGQAAYYLDTIELAGYRVEENYQIAVRRVEPFDVMTFSYTEEFLDVGRQRYFKGLENIAALINSHRNSSDFKLRISS
jgi:hypothetical protein